MYRNTFIAMLFGGLIISSLLFYLNRFSHSPVESVTSGFHLEPLPTEAPTPTVTLIPTPRPLTFAEMNEKYGPCTVLPILMYHHVQTKEAAELKKQTGLTVYTPTFSEHMLYLKQAGYSFISPSELIAFFDQGIQLPAKPIWITFDDGYDNNFTDAYPVLRDNSIKATIFLATGLMENPGYLSWNQVVEMNASGLIHLGNHTWSHKSMQSDLQTDLREITTADEQLSTRGLNIPKVFAYPYGLSNTNALSSLNTVGYTLAVTTQPGRYACEKQRLLLPRIRMSNRSIQSMGF